MRSSKLVFGEPVVPFYAGTYLVGCNGPSFVNTWLCRRLMGRFQRYLRISWTAFWGLVAVLLVVLWVRSYWGWDNVVRFQRVSFGLYSCRGGVELRKDSTGPFDDETRWGTESYAVDDHHDNASTPASGFGWRGDWNNLNVFAPNWFLILVTATLAVAPRIRWRFNVRTLLVAVTLIAMGMGSIILLNR